MTKKPACGAEVSATVKRSDFGMTKNQASTADDVKIAVAIEALQQ
jgi:polyisoprenoid-binding protein YceI